MKIVVTGATGFVGRALCAHLAALGHAIVAPVRDVAKGTQILGASAQVVPWPGSAEAYGSLCACDVVVSLAGEPIAGRWTSEKKTRLRASRIAATRSLVAAIAALPEASRPRALVSASAVGYYGETEEEVDERAPPGKDFLAQLCVDWEHEAECARSLGVRVALARLGVVLAPHGGALAAMLTPFRLGLGGPVGNGRQWMSWIALADAVSLLSLLATDPRADGPVNVVSPTAVTNRDFSRALGKALHRPAVLPVPAVALRLAFGEGADVLLRGQRVGPARAGELGFTWVFGDLETALEAMF